MAYVFIRKAESNPPDYGAIAKSGATVALNAEDPHLQEEMQKARDAGAKVAVWLPAHQGQDPTQYAQHMASIVQYYKPDAILPNLEGMQNKASSGGAAWNQTMMQEFQKYVPQGSIPLDVVTEPGEKDFDYTPFLQFGGGVVNEAFTGDMKFKDPDEMRQALIDAGVPPDKINMLLAPGQSPGKNGTFSAYTWDDMNPAQRTAFLSAYASSPQTQNYTSGPAQSYAAQRALMQNKAQPYQIAPTPDKAKPAQAGQDQFTKVKPKPAGQDQFTQVTQKPDSENPAAIAYANQRLAELKRMGYTPEMYGIYTNDPTAAWRELSSIVGAVEAARAGQAANYQIPAGTNPQVGATVSDILAHARSMDQARAARMIAPDIPESAPPVTAPPATISAGPPPPMPEIHPTAPSVARQLADPGSAPALQAAAARLLAKTPAPNLATGRRGILQQ